MHGAPPSLPAPPTLGRFLSFSWPREPFQVGLRPQTSSAMRSPPPLPHQPSPSTLTYPLFSPPGTGRISRHRDFDLFGRGLNPPASAPPAAQGPRAQGHRAGRAGSILGGGGGSKSGGRDGARKRKGGDRQAGRRGGHVERGWAASPGSPSWPQPRASSALSPLPSPPSLAPP
jgi:hypothetical protein